jgi:pyruvate kinase
LLAFTPVADVRSQLALTWGVETFLVPSVKHTDEMVKQVDSAMLDLGRMQEGELITIVAGSPPQRSGSTNAMRVHRLGGWVARAEVAEASGVTGAAGTIDEAPPAVGPS